MSFDFPESFLLLALVGVIGWFWPRLGLFRPLRILIVLVLVTMLAGPRIQKQRNALDLLVLLDRSESTEDLIDKGLPEWTRLLESSKPGRADTLTFVNFAAEVAEAGIDGSSFTGSRKLTKTGLAISNLMAKVDETKPTRVLLFTDGFSTEPLAEAASQLRQRGVPLDFRLIRDEETLDARLARLSFPERVQVGEPYLISVLVRGTVDGEIPSGSATQWPAPGGDGGGGEGRGGHGGIHGQDRERSAPMNMTRRSGRRRTRTRVITG